MRMGVDFGTTYTVVACADRGNYPVLSFTDDAGDAHEWFPSVVAEAGGVLRYGFDALANAEQASVLYSFKRLLAAPAVLPSTTITLGSVELTLEALVAGYLGALRTAILTRSNLPDSAKPRFSEGKEIEAVIAVPAHAHGAQRLMTLDAFRRAGFAPLAMLNEPSAAGFEFTHRHRSLLNSKRDHVVVYDLGGGTFDASLVRIRGAHHEVLATAGLNDLGGNDFDEVMLRLVLERLGERATDLPELVRRRLLVQCREAKERLHPSSRKLSIDLEAAFDSHTRPRTGTPLKTTELSISVADYYDACTGLVERTLETMQPVMARFEGEMQASAGLASQVAGVYVVGGASSLPLVARLLRTHYGRRVQRSPYPSAAVAIGLAIAADEQSDFELSDRFTHTFGVFREAEAGHGITFDPIFTRETRLPARKGDRVSCRRVYRAAHNVGHFRFLECSAVRDGRPAGDLVPSGDVLFPFDPTLRARDLSGIPIQRTLESGPHIEEEYTLDAHGMVAVTIRNLDENYQHEYRVGAVATGPSS
jgi:molecular chaperone DnaK (HSP70)